jgi:hypothetical protein
MPIEDAINAARGIIEQQGKLMEGLAQLDFEAALKIEPQKSKQKATQRIQN